MSAKSTNQKDSVSIGQKAESFAFMRMSFSQNARISRSGFEAILAARELPSLASLCKERNDTDAIRTAVSKLVQQVSTVLQVPGTQTCWRVYKNSADQNNPVVREGFVTQAGANAWADEAAVLFSEELLTESYQAPGDPVPAKLVDAPAKVPAGHLAIEFDLQARDSNVSYEKVGKLTYGSGDHADKGPKMLAWTPGPAWDKIPESLQEVLGNPGNLLEFGRDNLFDTDLRRVAEGLIEGFIKVWSGTWVVLTPDQKARAEAAKSCLATLEEGFVKVKTYTLEASASNKADLAEDAGKILTEQAEAILAQIQSGKGNLKALDKAFHKLREDADLVTKTLGVSLPREWEEIRDRVMIAMVNLTDDSMIAEKVA